MLLYITWKLKGKEQNKSKYSFLYKNKVKELLSGMFDPDLKLQAMSSIDEKHTFILIYYILF